MKTERSVAAAPLTHLQYLEGESIHILREAVAEAERPVMLYSMGKDSAVMLHLAMKAFFPGKPPFPLLHIDTTWKFRDMIAFRDRRAKELGLELIVHTNADGLAQDVTPFTRGSAVYTDIMKTQALRQALDEYRFDAAIGGARRDEEKSRAKERIVSVRSAQHRWDPKRQRPELWRLFNMRKQYGESLRIFPLSNWTELDVWQYIHLENIGIVPLYLAAERPVVRRDGALIMVDDDRLPLEPGEEPQMRTVRFRTLGCYPLTGAVESTAASVPEIVRELSAATMSSGTAASSTTMPPLRWRGRNRKAISDGASGGVMDVEHSPQAQEQRTLLRFMTCGSVDDGKSTLIGRLLYESKLIFDDDLAALEADSKKTGRADGALDLSLLVDGLAAEREQGITIDVAYRFFSTQRRNYIVADTPGHEQYTRNMATGASTAELAVILVDAAKGVLTQTRRHTYIVSLLGIRRIVLAVNKMDTVGFEPARFEAIEAEYRTFAARLGLHDIVAIPMSALAGDNVTARSANTPWYRGPDLMSALEAVPGGEAAVQPFRLWVQWVNRQPGFRGVSGRIASGTVRRGERVRVLPSAAETRVSRIVTYDGDLEEASAGRSVTLTLEQAIDVSRGDLLAGTVHPPALSDQFQTHVIWMSEAPLLPGRMYSMKIGALTAGASVTRLRYKIDVNTLEHVAGEDLALNEIAVCNIAVDRPIPFDAYAENRETGGFILIDRITSETAGAGLINFALRRSQNVHWQALDVHKEARANAKGQKPCVLWFTGLSGAGKSTIANAVEKRLHALGRHTYLLDGDNVRHGLNKDLGFTDADRVENIRRIAELAKLMVDAGLIVLVAFISPFRSERRLARELLEPGEFYEIFVDTPLDEAERRDVKGLYAKARRGELQHFTGIDSPYEPPEHPEVHLDTLRHSAESASELVVELIEARGTQ